jgi:hypothetical protein
MDTFNQFVELHNVQYTPLLNSNFEKSIIYY